MMDKLSNTFKVVKLARHEAVKNGELEIKLKRGYGPTKKRTAFSNVSHRPCPYSHFLTSYGIR